MPLPVRLIQPVNVSRGTLQVPVPDELEGVTNGTLANIIRQLSSLSKHAEEMFGNLFQEAEGIAHRSSNLQARIDRIAVKVTQLDSTVEEVSLQDIHLRKAFRSTQSFDQQVVSRDTMPKAMMEAYVACDPPPPLSKLNPYREDGKDGLKFYTDPTYFFELWRQEMLKDTERMMHDKGKKPGRHHNSSSSGNGPGGGGSGGKSDRSKKRVRQPGSTADRQRQKAVGQGEYIMQQQQEYGQYDQQFQPPPPPEEDFMHHRPSLYPTSMDRPNSIELQSHQYGGGGGGAGAPPPQMGGPPGSSSAYRYNPDQEPIYTPRILRSEQPTSPQRHQMQYDSRPQQQQQQPAQMYQFQQQQHHQNDIGGYNFSDQQQQPLPTGSGSQAGTPTRRPNQPPPAPPSPSRTQGGSNRDSLPPPPPPPISEMQGMSLTSTAGGAPLPPPMGVQSTTTAPSAMHQSSPLHSQLTAVLNNRFSTQQQTPTSAADLPPPPPVPSNDVGASNHLLGARVPPEHLPPSPPPPPPAAEPPAPPLTTTAAATTNGLQGAPAPPPPPPPPPMAPLINGITNGDVKKKEASPVKTNGGSPPKSKALSPQGLKKPAAAPNPISEVRSDLLKAIRDGIALRKVEEKKADGKGTGGTSDVASILARRVALEMSDSDAEGRSDSEYDSDEWGDESTA